LDWPPHDFQDPAKLELALTHASASGGKNNERLELLGDAVLSLIAARELLRRLPAANEGSVSQRRAWLVSRPVLAAAASKLDLARRARLGAGLEAAQLPARLMAGLYEALLGAIYEDGGFAAAEAFVLDTLGAPIELACAVEFGLDPKQELQQWAQARALGLPQYVLLAENGSAHARTFQIAVELDDSRYPAAWGRTRKEAERWAAFEALLRLPGTSAAATFAPTEFGAESTRAARRPLGADERTEDAPPGANEDRAR
jgi:ribonuclease-3